jgi:hypothetical protein
MTSIRTRLERLEETAGRSDGLRRVCLAFQLPGMTEDDAVAEAKEKYMAMHGTEAHDAIALVSMM